MNRGRGQSLIRVLALLRELQAGARGTLREFAERHNVCARTVRRDMYLLESVGYAICRSTESGERGEDLPGVWWLARKSEASAEGRRSA